MHSPADSALQPFSPSALPVTSAPALVTGGTGFLGRRIVERLLAQKRPVTILARRVDPDLAARGVRFITASLDIVSAANAIRSGSSPIVTERSDILANRESKIENFLPPILRDACAGIHTVFHTAAKVGVWGRYDDYYRVNVLGTLALLASARAHGVRNFVYTSTPSVVYNGRDLANADESLPLTTHCPSPYPLTKALAEREVLAANGSAARGQAEHCHIFSQTTPGAPAPSDTPHSALRIPHSETPALRTIALRPHLIWGNDDPHLIPRVLAQARSNRLRIVGSGHNRVDMVHVENAVDAHLCAEAAVEGASSPWDWKSNTGFQPVGLSGAGETRTFSAHTEHTGWKPALPDPHGLEARATQSPAGHAYFITNGEPVALWDWINTLLVALDIPPVTRRISLRAATALGACCETAWRLLPLRGEPPMTRFIAAELAKDHWFNITAARRDLNYTPRITMSEGTKALVEHLKKRQTASS